ncbi:MAG: GIY-YIG nuclease family protein [bacterium]|nr:GIY-YIG nuclease family protein [bacterium]
MYSIYILKSEINASYYVGSCKNVEKRIGLHNSGLVKSTKRYKPWRLAYREEYDSLSRARKRELQIKSWKKRVAIENLIKSRISRLHRGLATESEHDSFGGPMV